MDLIEKLDMFTEKTYTVKVNKKVRLMSDDELLGSYRENPDKEKYEELEIRKLHNHPLVRGLKPKKR